MWDLLKSKVSSFISKLTGETKQEDAKQRVEEQKIDEKENETAEKGEERIPAREKEKIEQLERETKVGAEKEGKTTEQLRGDTRVAAEKEEEKTKQLERDTRVAALKEEKKIEQEHAQKSEEKKREKENATLIVKGDEKKAPLAEAHKQTHELKEGKADDGIKVKVGITDHLKRIVLRKIRLSREKVEEIATELEFSLIQSDVHPDVARGVCNRISERLADKEYGSSDDLEREIKGVLRQVFLEEAFGKNEPFDLVEKVKGHSRPCKILFVGPNGAGKTTTIAKVAKMLMNAGLSVVISASDTFRAAAIEQTEEHGRRLGVRVIRHDYGGDAAAVAFDAIKHAEANGIDVVLIDSAGRQDTNFNLLKELEKINRIARPDIKIFIGESLAGNSLYQQVKRFNDTIRLDGIILTKADCDAKGGTAISIVKETGVPIIYIGVGQRYEDLQKFDPTFIIDKII